nr:hypothetical protein CFP56_44507 [Quercus suber]
MVNLIIKDMDMDECGKHAIEDLGVFGFFDLAIVRMKALQAKYEAKEGVVRHQHTRLEYEADKLNQYKEATCILNDELTRKKCYVAALYPDLDLSRVVIDDLILPMPGIADAVLSEANDIVYLVEGEVKKPA